MNKYPTSKDDLVKALEQTFPEEPKPPAERLVYDSTGRHPECIQVLIDYSAVRWTDIPSDVLGFNTDALHCMTYEAFAYYLPAFIRKYLRDRKSADVIPQELLTELTRGEANPERFGYLETHLLPSQKRFIVAFLEYVRDADEYYSSDAEVALASYWRQATC